MFKMVSLTLIKYLSIGTIAMWIPIVIQTIWYKIKWWKSIPIAFILTIVGTIGTYLLFFVENHWIGGTSFFGAVFLVPAVFPLVAKLFRVSYGELMDLCAPAECIMLAIMKVQCLLVGCCSGRELFVNAEGVAVYFPSQIAELTNALVIFAVLMIVSLKKTTRGYVFPLYMTIYGITRFILNCFRAKTSPFVWILPAGHFWALIAVTIGVVWLLLLHRKKKQAAEMVISEI